ncbi:MAG: hypothetical protein ACK4M9_11795 [Anaerobacillus sp.]|uniref:hypothetical protein n=1 Tax=Anaerobacillus sp. TaxID=1872506 RepID=UPI003918BDDA
MTRTKKLLMFFLLFFAIQPESVLAHRMIVELVEPGKIKVRYDDGTKSGIALVKAFDEEGHSLFEKYVDDNGYVYFDRTIRVHQLIADDGIGHRATWISDHASNQLDIPIWIRALLGVSILLFTATFFHYRKHN